MKSHLYETHENRFKTWESKHTHAFETVYKCYKHLWKKPTIMSKKLLGKWKSDLLFKNSIIVENTKLADSFLIAEKFSNFSTDFDLELALKSPQSNNHCLKYINVASSLFQYTTTDEKEFQTAFIILKTTYRYDKVTTHLVQGVNDNKQKIFNVF